MKKIFLIFALLFLTSNSILADELLDDINSTNSNDEFGFNTENTSNNMLLSKFACEQNELSELTDKRYFDVPGSAQFPRIVSDTKTVKIDRNNKTIKIWRIFVVSKQGRQLEKQQVGRNGSYNSFGYEKHLDIIDYSMMRSSMKTITTYKCDGNSIETFKGNGTWDDIVPGSVMEGSMEAIIKKYKLK